MLAAEIEFSEQKRVLGVRPDAAIHEPDGRFPSNRGSYLTAAVLYATLLGRNPAEVSYAPGSIVPDLPTTKTARRQYDEIPAEDLVFLRQVAWETVQEYQAGEILLCCTGEAENGWASTCPSGLVCRAGEG